MSPETQREDCLPFHPATLARSCGSHPTEQKNAPEIPENEIHFVQRQKVMRLALMRLLITRILSRAKLDQLIGSSQPRTRSKAVAGAVHFDQLIRERGKVGVSATHNQAAFMFA